MISLCRSATRLTIGIGVSCSQLFYRSKGAKGASGAQVAQRTNVAKPAQEAPEWPMLRVEFNARRELRKPHPDSRPSTTKIILLARGNVAGKSRQRRRRRAHRQ